MSITCSWLDLVLCLNGFYILEEYNWFHLFFLSIVGNARDALCTNYCAKRVGELCRRGSIVFRTSEFPKKKDRSIVLGVPAAFSLRQTSCGGCDL